MKTDQRIFATLAAAGVCAVTLIPAAWSQQKFPLGDSDSVSEYLEERAIDVGDIPGHQVRIYRIRYTYPKKDLVFLGIPVKESYTSGISDYTDWSGQFTTYSVLMLEDGNKIFARGTGNSQAHPDGSRRFTFVSNFTGGTGPFRGIRGQTRGGGERAAGAKSLSQSSTGQYWVEQ
jgi:hypothetical protein